MLENKLSASKIESLLLYKKKLDDLKRLDLTPVNLTFHEVIPEIETLFQDFSTLLKYKKRTILNNEEEAFLGVVAGNVQEELDKILSFTPYDPSTSEDRSEHVRIVNTLRFDMTRYFRDTAQKALTEIKAEKAEKYNRIKLIVSLIGLPGALFALWKIFKMMF